MPRRVRPCVFCGVQCRLALAEARMRTAGKRVRASSMARRIPALQDLIVTQAEAYRLALHHLHSARVEINVRRRHAGVPVLP